MIHLTPPPTFTLSICSNFVLIYIPDPDLVEGLQFTASRFITSV